MKFLGLKPQGLNEIGSSVQVTGSLNVSGSITGSLFGTSSWALSASWTPTSDTSAFVLNSQTSSMTVYSSSYATTASYLVGLGASSGSLSGSYALANFSNLATWSFIHNIGYQYVNIQVYDENNDVMIPNRINLVDNQIADIYFTVPMSGIAIATLGTGVVTASSNYNVGNSSVGSNLLFNRNTGSYSSLFVKYTLSSGSNARSGQIMSVWNGSSIKWTETSTTDIGDTSSVTASIEITQSSNVKLEFYTPTSGWNIKTLNEFI